MKILVVNRNLIVSIFAVMLFVYGSQGVSYGQGDALTVTPGETNTSLVVKFQITLDEGVDENAYQVQLRRETPQGEWTSKCVVLQRGNRWHIAGDPDVFASAVYISSGVFFLFGDFSDDTFRIKAIFTDLEPGATYEVRYRDTNVSECTENPPNPDPWSHVAEGTTHLVAPPRAEFVDANLAKQVRYELGLYTKGGHIDLLKIPQASLAKLTELASSDAEITDITGLEHATQLIYLELDRNQISNITPLAKLTQLKRLWLWQNQISDISPLAGLPNLESLFLSSNQISDVTLLTTFASLESLGTILLSGNPITDVSPIRKLKREHPNLRIFIDIPVILTDPGDEPDLYVIADGSILQLNLNKINVQEIGHESFSASDIAIDSIGGKIYWIQRANIQRANLDGTHVQDVVTGLHRPYGIALDVPGSKIYWMEEDDHRIRRANLDGTNVQDAVTGLNRPYRIALDVPGGKIYWIEGYRIQRANLDGTNVQDVVTGLDKPKDIAIDVSGGKIYWTERESGQIQRANLDGSDAHPIVVDLDRPTGIALDIAGNRIYWTDFFQSMIWRANLDGSDVHRVAIGVSYLTAIAVHDRTVNIPATPMPAITDAAVSISPASVVFPAVGKQLELNLQIIGGKAVAGYQATVQFDDTALRYVSGANGDFLPAGAFFVDPKVEGNLVKLNAASLAGENNGDGILTTLTFEVIAVKTSTLTLSDVLLTNSAGETFVPRIENGEITESTGLKGDVNGDGTVNIADLVLVAGALGETGENIADVNGDGQVNIADLVLVAGALGNSAAAPSLHLQSLDMLTTAEVKMWLSTAQQLGLTDTTSQRGLLFLQQLLAALTPKKTVLLANYPNPFNPETWIPYHLAKDADVTLHIYAVNGTLVRTLALGHQPAGMYQNRSRAAYWDGKNAFGEPVASGVYFYTLTVGDFSATRKMLIRK